MYGWLTMADLTLHEARQRKVLLAMLVLGAAFLSLFATGFYFINRNLQAEHGMQVQERRLILSNMVMAGMYAVNFLMIMTAVLTPVDTISGEIGSGVIQTLVTKPVRRSDILLGKWLGFWIILVIYLTLMIGGIMLAVRVFGKFTPPNLKIGIPLMLLEGTLLLTLSIAGGTRLSTIANGVMVFGLYGLAFIGGWMEQIGTLLGNSVTRYIGILASLLVPSEALWQLAAYHMQPPLMRDLHLTPFSPVSIPNSNMVIWAAIYTLATLGVALRQFSQRNL
jgi:ABC-type transport system involved in multi-copper enzyme maturation permease subunit